MFIVPILAILIVLLVVSYTYYLLVRFLLDKVENRKIKLLMKAMSVVIAYLVILLTASIFAVQGIGSMESGVKTALYGFHAFVFIILFAIKSGFPITLSNVTDTIFWTYTLIGAVIYFTFIFISHYYLFQLKNRKKLISVFVGVNFLAVVGYLFFEAAILGHVTI